MCQGMPCGLSTLCTSCISNRYSTSAAAAGCVSYSQRKTAIGGKHCQLCLIAVCGCRFQTKFEGVVLNKAAY